MAEDETRQRAEAEKTAPQIIASAESMPLTTGDGEPSVKINESARVRVCGREKYNTRNQNWSGTIRAARPHLMLHLLILNIVGQEDQGSPGLMITYQPVSMPALPGREDRSVSVGGTVIEATATSNCNLTPQRAGGVQVYLTPQRAGGVQVYLTPQRAGGVYLIRTSIRQD